MKFNRLKKVLLTAFLFTNVIYAQDFSLGQAKGLFFSLGIGPKLPIGDFSAKNGLGIGLDLTLSYADNRILPVFLYTKLGYQHFPASNDLPKISDYSSFYTNVFLILPGVRFYFAPVIKDEIIIMPIVEAGLSFGIFNNTHIFKNDSNRNNYDETLTKFGFHVSGGFSMFLLETTISYYYFPNNHSLSLDLRIQIPIFAKI
ncbi:hypothetical protein MNBD_IGNAVI01-1903 [hydrothermal vent metagenome]|uniref:Outer membrane protein beta-barrel domain-containing protein n=1 Tax=hydrothermal vent metagenome TaxID=652676 RepID=A0A3B1BKA5_9ZZZZ